MPTAVKDAFSKVVEFFRNMEKKTRNRLIMLTAVFVVLVVVIIAVSSHKTYANVFTSPDKQEVSEAYDYLREQNIDVKIQGSSIAVPENMVDEVRIELAGKGYPKTGYFTYDIFEKGNSMSATETDKQFYMQEQKGLHIAQSLSKMEKVNSATVLLNLPKGSNFVISKDAKASAAVVLELNTADRLSQEEVNVITALVAKSVEGLDPENITITDTSARSYKAGESGAYSTEEHYQLQRDFEELTLSKVQEMVERIYGKDNVHVAVNAVLDFDDVQTERIEFSPVNDETKEGIKVSVNRLVEVITDSSTGGVAGFDPNGADDTSQYPILEDSGQKYYQYSEQVNYEVDEELTKIKRAKGSVKSLSVAITIDDKQEDFTDEIKDLVAKTVGIDVAPEEQGNYISVQMLPLSPIDKTAEEEAAQAQKDALSRQNLIAIIRLVLLVVGIVASLFMLLSIVRTLVSSASPAGYRRAHEGVDITIDEDGVVLETPLQPIDTSKAKNLAQVEEYIDKSPEEVAQLLRNWLLDN